jgi:hypothetical protein
VPVDESRKMYATVVALAVRVDARLVNQHRYRSRRSAGMNERAFVAQVAEAKLRRQKETPDAARGRIPKKVFHLPEILNQEQVARLIDVAEFPHATTSPCSAGRVHICSPNSARNHDRCTPTIPSAWS